MSEHIGKSESLVRLSLCQDLLSLLVLEQGRSIYRDVLVVYAFAVLRQGCMECSVLHHLLSTIVTIGGDK